MKESLLSNMMASGPAPHAPHAKHVGERTKKGRGKKKGGRKSVSKRKIEGAKDPLNFSPKPQIDFSIYDD